MNENISQSFEKLDMEAFPMCGFTTGPAAAATR
jgi:hypothetical protein